MSLEIILNASTQIITEPALTESVDKIVIDRIVDYPSHKKVIVHVFGKPIELESLSGDNYDSPSEWTNADIINAVRAHFNV